MSDHAKVMSAFRLGELAHRCHAEGCDVLVPPRLLMCLKHWRMVPKALQARVWATYRPGQEIDKRVTEAYLVAQAAAIEAVAESEGRREPTQEATMTNGEGR